MGDTKTGREKQARDADGRQREQDEGEARDRADESKPPRDDPPDGDETQNEGDGTADSPRLCHRRDCTEPAEFVVVERYQEETGHGAVEARAVLCRAHTAEESPVNLDGVYADYLFRVEPLPETDLVSGDSPSRKQ